MTISQRATATLTAFLLSALSLSPVFAQSSQGVLQGGAQSSFLQGGVEHSERMAPVQSALKVGITYDESRLEKPVATKEWYRVPPWLAGSWVSDESTQTSSLDYKTGVTDNKTFSFKWHVTDEYGCQKDRLGGIWDYNATPYSGEVWSDQERFKDFTTQDGVVFDSDARLIMRSVYTRATLDKANKIGKVVQMESIGTSLPCGPGMVRKEYSLKQFDDHGNPDTLLKGWRIGRKTAPAKVGNGVDPSFRQYLMQHNLENLVPLQ